MRKLSWLGCVAAPESCQRWKEEPHPSFPISGSSLVGKGNRSLSIRSWLSLRSLSIKLDDTEKREWQSFNRVSGLPWVDVEREFDNINDFRNMLV